MIPAAHLDLALCRRELFSAVVGDVMDKLGLLHQFLPAAVRPLDAQTLLVGRAMTVLEADADLPPDPPFGRMLAALDDLHTDEIYLCAGASPRYALWGELMSVRAKACGAVGAVMDGFHRDTSGIRAQGFPVFSHGAYAQDQAPRGTVLDFRCGLTIGHVRISDGDLIFGDIDGVCVVPQAAAPEVIALALEKARGEKTVRAALERGMSARDAFATYGICLLYTSDAADDM
jgi:regulator of RNase E activity RraA